MALLGGQQFVIPDVWNRALGINKNILVSDQVLELGKGQLDLGISYPIVRISCKWDNS